MVNSQKVHKRNSIILTLLIIVLVLLGLVFFMAKICLKDNAIKVSGPLGTKIPVSKIESIEIKDTLPKDLRKNIGINLFDFSFWGKYSSKELGEINMYVFNNEKPYIYIKEKGEDKINIISVKNKEDLKKVYEKTKEQLNS